MNAPGLKLLRKRFPGQAVKNLLPFTKHDESVCQGQAFFNFVGQYDDGPAAGDRRRTS